MILHIGNNISILKNDILAILDKDTVNNSDYNRDFIDKLIQNGRLKEKIGKDIKSYIITFKRGTLNLYISNISSNTLLNRKMI